MGKKTRAVAAVAVASRPSTSESPRRCRSETSFRSLPVIRTNVPYPRSFSAPLQIWLNFRTAKRSCHSILIAVTSSVPELPETERGREIIAGKIAQRDNRVCKFYAAIDAAASLQSSGHWGSSGCVLSERLSRSAFHIAK